MMALRMTRKTEDGGENRDAPKEMLSRVPKGARITGDDILAEIRALLTTAVHPVPVVGSSPDSRKWRVLRNLQRLF